MDKMGSKKFVLNPHRQMTRDSMFSFLNGIISNDCTKRSTTVPKVVVVILGLLLANQVAAVQMTKEEYQLLPVYCRNQSNVAGEYFRPDNEVQWRNRLGKDFQHIHHYCWGMVSLARAYRSGQTYSERKFRFEVAVKDFYFSINNSTPDFVLLPEIYTKAGEAYLGLRDDRNAEKAFKSAWEANPTYWPAYLWWAQRLMKQGKQREALAIAEEGLNNAPGTKPLEQIIAELRGSDKTRK